MEELNEFFQLLTNLLHTETEFRQKAEKIYEGISTVDKIRLLFSAIDEDNKPEELRQLAAILLRRVLFQVTLKDFDTLFVHRMKDSAMALIQKENINLVLRKKVCDIVSELANKISENETSEQWPDLLHFMFNAANSTNLEFKECSLIILNSCPNIFGDEQMKYLDFIKKMLMKFMTEESNEQIKLEALKATISFISYNSEDKTILKLMADTIFPILKITSVVIENDDDQPLLALIELAERCPQILRANFAGLLEICLKVITNNNYSEKLRHSAIELVVTYAEHAAPTFRKRGSHCLITLVSHFLMMMTDLDYDETWSQNENDEDEEDDSNSDHIIGETALDRLACSLGGKLIFPLAINIISQMLQDTDWKKRCAGLMAISALGEGCNKQMQPMLNQIVNAIIPFIGDPHPRVRYAVCVALGQMASDFSPFFQQQFHDAFIYNLLILLDDNDNPKVQAHAGAAFVNFFEEDKPKAILKYVDAIVDKFEQILKLKIDELMNSNKKLVLEQILVSIASFAELIQELFVNYYDRFMPYLKFIIENANHKDLRLLRGKAIECASLIGLVVGSKKFCTDASHIMNILLQTQTGELILEDDDPQLSYMITSWVRICKLLGPDFEPYLPMVMPQVLKTASIKVGMTLVEGDIEGKNSDWKFFSINEQQNLGIKVSGLDDKATACEMLVCYARELKHGFVNYLQDTVTTLVPLLNYYLHEGIRTAAAQSLPYLLECAKSRGETYVLELWNYILNHLLPVLLKEVESDVLAEMLISLADCITTARIPLHLAFNESQMDSLLKVLDYHFNEHFERSKERQEKRHDEDYDDGAEELLNDEDEDDVYILTKLVDVLHSLFATYNEQFLPYFHNIFKHIVNLASPDRPPAHQQWAICIVDDLIEFTGEKCIDYQDFFLPLLVTNLKSPHSELRQAACYGMGILGKNGDKRFEQILSENVPIMVAMIQDANSRNEENIYATENSIAAITKIIQFNGGMVDIDSLLPCWLSWLPIWMDEEEVINVYTFLYQLLESNHPLILGADNCNVPRIVSVILEVFARNVIEHTSELGQKLITYIKYVNLDKSISSNFPPEQQQVLEQINKY